MNSWPFLPFALHRRRSRLSPLSGAAYAFALVTLCALATAAQPPVEVIRDRTYVERQSGPLAMDVYVPPGAGPFPGMLVVHGGAWHMGSRAQFATTAMTLAEHGYTAASISYRLAPKDKFPAQIHDCQAAVRWLREHAGEFRIDPQRIGGYGYSAGGQLVALLGALGDDDLREQGVPPQAPSARLQVVLAGGAPCDFRVLVPQSDRLAYWLGGTPSDKPNAYRNASPASFITADDPPMFFFHGQRDELVPVRSPQRMVERLVAAGVAAEMHTLPSAGHISPVFDSEALGQAIAFADRYLKPIPARRAVPGPISTAAADHVSKGGASHGE